MSAGREDIDKTVYTGYSLTSVSRDRASWKTILPPSRPCYVCDADTGVTREGVPLCVGCR